jgi:hypothetical protein
MRGLRAMLLVGVCISSIQGSADERVSRSELAKLIVGKTVTWSDYGGQSYYGVGGKYRYASSRQNSQGTWGWCGLCEIYQCFLAL